MGRLGNRCSLDQHGPELFRDEQERPGIILKREQLEPKQEGPGPDHRSRTKSNALLEQCTENHFDAKSQTPARNV